VGAVLAKIHEADVVHGDLTTSNLMLRDHGNERDQLVGLKHPLSFDKGGDLRNE